MINNNNKSSSKNSFFPKNHKAQITIFIIVGIVLVSLIALFFFFRDGGLPDIGGTGDVNPDSFLDSCMEEKIKETIGILSAQGGHIKSQLYLDFKFSDENLPTNISYLCYNHNYYLPCINQEPMLIQHLKEEIYNYISEDVENCFDDLTASLENQGYVVDARYSGFEVELMEKKLVVNVDGELTLTKSGETSKKKGFKIIVPTKFYDLAVVVQEIVSQEARFCNFEHLGFMLFYPKFNIDKFRTGDGTIIYTIEHRDSKEKFRFAVRGCVIPPGF